MPDVQTNYPENIARALPGMIASQEPQVIISRVLQDEAALPFGKAVFRGTAANQCTATPAAARFLGVSVLDVVQETTGYASRSTVGILNKGPIWVTNGAAAVSHGQPVYVTPAGAFTNVAQDNVALPDVEFDTSAAAGALVRLRLK